MLTERSELVDARKELAVLYNAYFAGARVYSQLVEAEREVIRLASAYYSNMSALAEGDSA